MTDNERMLSGTDYELTDDRLGAFNSGAVPGSGRVTGRKERQSAIVVAEVICPNCMRKRLEHVACPYCGCYIKAPGE